MTIANAINDITVAQGGTASAGGRVTDALDALADALAGSDVPEGRTIEDNIAIVGQYIGGGGGFDYDKHVYIVAADSCDAMIAADADLSKVMFSASLSQGGGMGALADMYFIYNVESHEGYEFGITENDIWSETLTPDAVLTVDENTYNCYKLLYLDSEDKAYQIRYVD